MAKLKVELKGEGIIDNAAIYLEDEAEKLPHFLDPKNDKEWLKENISIPLEGELDYSLYVVAFSGTKFKCTISDEEENKIELSGVTGSKTKNRAHLKGSEKLK